MGWWVLGVVVGLLAAAYLVWLTARVNRLHRRAATATAALDAALVRRAAAAAVLAEQLSAVGAAPAEDLYATARAALDAEPADREPAENDLTLLLRRLPELVTGPMPGWPAVAGASRRVALARQVHTDVVRDALAVRRRVLVRMLGLSRRHRTPAYFDVDDPGLADEAAGAAAGSDHPSAR